jgi:hypothetical protein
LKFIDGQIAQVSAKKVLKAAQESGLKQEVEAFLEKQGESDVLVRVCSKGCSGYVARLLEPGYGESNIFVKFDDAKQVKTEGVNEMKAKELLEKANEEIVQLKKELENSKQNSGTVPKIRYEAAKKLIEGLAERVKNSKGIPEEKYLAAKKLIAGLVEKVNMLEKEKMQEENRVKAATKLIHKIVSEKKVKKDDKELKKDDKKEEAKVEEKEEIKVEEKAEIKIESKPSSIEEAVRYSSRLNKKEEKVEVKVEEKAVEEQSAITNESQELIRRIHGVKVDITESKKPVNSSNNLMGALATRIS